MKEKGFWQRNKKDIIIILLAEVGVVIMGFVWVFLFLI